MDLATLRSKLKKNLASYGSLLASEGLAPCLECFVRHAGEMALGMSPRGHPRLNHLLYGLTDAFYDRLNHVDTGGMIDLPEMEGKGRNYLGTPPRAWKLVMGHLPVDPARFTYVDFGCGKGRTLLLASAMGFRRLIGVDLSPGLLAVARQNLASKGLEAELVCGDVRDFAFPEEPLVLFMYNPFYLDVMRQVAENLRASVLARPRDVYVVYYSAACKEAWRLPEFEVHRETDYIYPNYAIYHADG